MPPVSLGSNIASLTAQRRLAEGTTSLSKTFERLSSGQRINRASDDAAGLAIASNLSASRRVFTQGIRNLNDGISLLNVADGAVEQLSGIMIRLKELGEQAANGTYGVKQRKAIDGEAQALSKEYFRIARSTTFNGQGIFFAEFGDLRLQSGYGLDGGIQSGLGGAIGTGSFGGAVSYAMESNSSQAISLGDLNGDGILDLVTAGDSGAYSPGYATIRLGTGNGSFGEAVSYSTEGQSSHALSLGDLDGDGILDLVSAGQTSSSYTGAATIRLGTGDGSFSAAVSYRMESNFSADLSLGDLNGDGILDLVTAGSDGSDGKATIRLGTGDGSFGEAVSYLTESQISSALSLGDLNGDGILDLVTAGYGSGSGRATIRLGTGTGSFGAAVSYAMESPVSHALSLGDLNNDGILDLVTAGIGASYGSATIRLGTGDGSFGAAVSYATESSYSNALSLGDLNGDGILDLVTAGNGAYGGVATIRLGTGSGSFGAAVSYAMDTRALSLGDLNGDGVLDLVTAGTEGLEGRATIRLSDTASGVSPLLSFKLTTRADALQALSQFDQKLNQLSAQRGTIGAFQSRIAVATDVLQASTENYAAAAGRIQDADVAQESAQLVRTQILQQAASSVLAQANQQPALALQLLQ